MTFFNHVTGMLSDFVSSGPANANGEQGMKILYASPIQKLKRNAWGDIAVRDTNYNEILRQIEKYATLPVIIMIKDNSGNIYEFIGKMQGYSCDIGVGVNICGKHIKIKKNGKLLEYQDELSLENVQFIIARNIPSKEKTVLKKIVLKYEKDLPFLLECYVDRRKAEELKKQIEGGTTLIIEAKKHNAKYKYIIEEVHNCEISDNVLKIKFNGKVYRNDKPFINERLEHFASVTENITYTLSQLQQTKEPEEIEVLSPSVITPREDSQNGAKATIEKVISHSEVVATPKPNPAAPSSDNHNKTQKESEQSKQKPLVRDEVSSPNVNQPQNPQAEPNVNKVTNIGYILCSSKEKYSFENYKLGRCVLEFAQEDDIRPLA